jgi:uncharacterized protein (TIGR02246 family)
MKKRTIYGLLIIVTLVFYISVAPSATAASAEEEVLQLLSDYFKGWNTNDNKLMASVHWNSPDFSFFGSNKDVSFLTKGWDETAEGLKTTFEVPVGTYSLTYHEPQVLMLGDNVAIVTLYSIWNVNNTETNEQGIDQIRGTLVLEKMRGEWRIIHLHWSILPTE